MRFVTLLLGAGLLFMSGMITGYHYAQSHWLDAKGDSDLVEEEQQVMELKKEEQENSDDLASDLLKKQAGIKEKGAENIFSNIGQSLDVFNPSSNGN
ncbi:hypothetical protein [Alteribacillus sp. YIM 98480]|uniref:hypothetical protein n=1 Tax=Alteribacillus sp. YIM 98480 TaxID=2606599 RepID=UPI00131EBA7B|nr:hypothetical protein [Alteribacillus sp. YIM 98480]